MFSNKSVLLNFNLQSFLLNPKTENRLLQSSDQDFDLPATKRIKLLVTNIFKHDKTKRWK